MRTTRSGHQGRRFVLAGALSSAVVLALSIGVVGAQGEAMYTFSSVTVSTDAKDPNIARVGFDIGWTSDDWPGTHRCSTKVLASDGSIIGETTGLLVSIDGYHMTSFIGVSGAPATAAVACDPKRLDTGGEYAYEFSRVEVIQASTAADSFVVRFDARWLGTGTPGPVDCLVSVYDAAGTRIVSRAVEILIMEGAGRGIEVPFRSQEYPSASAAATAQVESCAPSSS